MANKKDKNDGLDRIGRVEREEKVKKNVRYATIFVLVLVSAVLLYGIITEFIIFPNQTIATVNGEVLVAKNFQTRVKFERRQLVNTFSNWYNYYYDAFQAGDEFTISYAQNEMERIQAQLDVESLGIAILNSMIEEIIIRQEAEELGITVTEEEVEEKIQLLFGYFPNGEPTQVVFPTSAPTSTLTAEQLLIATVVPTLASEDDPITKPEEVATQVVDSIPTAVATEFTNDAYEEIVDGFLDTVRDIGFKYDDLSAYVTEILYREKVQEAITNDLPRSEEQVWARHILVSSEVEALALYDRIMDGGDFAELAAELSTDTSTASRGGDLGWFGRDAMIEEFATTAFETPLYEISEPVETSFGFHIIQVVGHEVRTITQNIYEQMQLNEFNNWLIEKTVDYEIVVEDYWIDRIPSEPAIPVEINTGQ